MLKKPKSAKTTEEEVAVATGEGAPEVSQVASEAADRAESQSVDESGTPEAVSEVADQAGEYQGADKPDTPEVANGTAGQADEGQGKDEEIAQLMDKNLRLAAELQNLRRSGAQDLQRVARYGITSLVEGLVPVADALAETLATQDDVQVKVLKHGVDLAHKELLKALQQCGTLTIDAEEGTTFDPNMHEAIGAIPSQTHAEGVVVECIRGGWKLHDRVVRAAMVTVSNGPGSQNQAGEPTGNQNEETNKGATNGSAEEKQI